MAGTSLDKYKPPAAPIDKTLLKKNELTLRERLWVWNDVVTFALSLVAITIGIAWYLVLLPQVFGVLLVSFGTLSAIASGMLYYQREESGALALGSAGRRRVQLDHKERAKLCLYDRNRRARPHRNEYKFANKRYSVWPDYDDYNGEGKRSVLILLEHVRPGPYLFTYVLPRRFRFSQRAWAVQIAQSPDSIRYISAPGEPPDPAKLHELMEELEQIAAAGEAIPHEKQIKEFAAEEAMLDLRRRPPKGSQSAVKAVRKQLNK